MTKFEGLLPALATVLDALVADPAARDRAKLALLEKPDTPDLRRHFEAMARSLTADGQADVWTSRARPGFLYVMYAMLLWTLPLGVIGAFSPSAAAAMARSMTLYLQGIPEPLYALFGTAYLGYSAMRQWGKVKGTDR